MTNYTTVTLVPFLQWGDPSAYYDGGNTYAGNAVPAANYYGGQGSLQTIIFDVDALVGNIIIEATLTDLPDSAPWFEIARLEANNQSEVRSNTVVGNFSWIRATVTDFTAGNVNLVTASY
jgi:hypothetical protein